MADIFNFACSFATSFKNDTFLRDMPLVQFDMFISGRACDGVSRQAPERTKIDTSVHDVANELDESMICYGVQH